MRIYVNCIAQNPITKCLGNTDDDNVVKEYFWVIQKKKKRLWWLRKDSKQVTGLDVKWW